jgi:hypothetical protein
VGIEIEVSAEGVAHDQDHQSDPVYVFGPLLDDGCTQGRQIVQEVTIAEEDGQSTSGIVNTTPANFTSGNDDHISRCQRFVARRPQLGQARDLQVWWTTLCSVAEA